MTVANSIAKTAQIIQFAITATVFQPPDASHSMISAGMTANVAASTTGSSGVGTRPDGSCDHTPPVSRLQVGSLPWLPRDNLSARSRQEAAGRNSNAA